MKALFLSGLLQVSIIAKYLLILYPARISYILFALYFHQKLNGSNWNMIIFH